MENDPWPWVTLALLGAWHGLNPAMGWLFGVALGLQQRSRSAVFASLAPIALCHAAAILLVILMLYALTARGRAERVAAFWAAENDGPV